jgi:phosphonoacetate hydrolase
MPAQVRCDDSPPSATIRNKRFEQPQRPAAGVILRIGDVAAPMRRGYHHADRNRDPQLMSPNRTRREFLHSTFAAASAATIAAPHLARAAELPQRTIIIMGDGFGLDYYDQSPMPTLKAWAAKGVFARARAVMPTVTNCNNASICCGSWPSEHGVIGNSYLDPETGTEEYMEDARLLLAPTMFERARMRGVHSALLSAKKKTIGLLRGGTDIALTAEVPDGDWERRLGKAPPIYSREINYWVLAAALDILRNHPEIGLVYIHTTDYPMHMWPPQAPESQEHLARLDALLAELAAAAPDAAILLSADHGMSFKSRAWDLEKALQERGAPVRMAISAERDRYVRHHQGMGGTAWVHLRAPEDAARVGAIISELAGIERVLTRAQAASEFNLMASRLGDLVVLGDRDTVFGTLDAATETMPKDFRTHGSLHEADVPVVLHNARAAPPPGYFKYNLDLARWAYRG